MQKGLIYLKNKLIALSLASALSFSLFPERSFAEQTAAENQAIIPGAHTVTQQTLMV